VCGSVASVELVFLKAPRRKFDDTHSLCMTSVVMKSVAPFIALVHPSHAYCISCESPSFIILRKS